MGINDGDLLVCGGQVLQADGSLEKVDLEIRAGKIKAFHFTAPAHWEGAVLDAHGLTVIPGVIDPQVHFRDPGLTHKEDLISASRACLRGGVTAFLEMPNTIPPTVTPAALTAKLARAAAVCRVHYGFFFGACGDCSNLELLKDPGPVCGIKVFMGSGKGILDCGDISGQERIFATGNALIAVHAEDQERLLQRRETFLAQYPNHTDRPADLHSQVHDPEAALIATKRAVEYSNRYGRRLHILHLTTGAEAEWLRKNKTPLITTEVTPQHLLIDSNAYSLIGNLAQMNPPLRTAVDREQLWQALLDGVIDCIATDHAPHTLEEKAKPYPHCPSGMPGVETSLPLMLTQVALGRCSLQQVSNWMSKKPAELYGIENKGVIAPGWDGDLVLVNLERSHPVLREEVVSRCGWSPFEGWELVGWPEATVVAGVVGYEKGRFNEACRGSALTYKKVINRG
jgi:dihydroorotase